MKKICLLLLGVLMFQSVSFAGPMGSGRKAVTTAGTAVALSTVAQPFTELTVCADPDNTGIIAVGTAPVASATIPQGVFLAASDCYTIEHTTNTIGLSSVKIDSTVSGESCSFEWQYK